MATTRLHTIEDLERVPEDGYRYDLIQGEIRRMAPTGEQHSDVTGELYVRIREFVKEHALGKVTVGDTAFVLSREDRTVLAPDVAYIRSDRLDPNRDTTRFFSVPPDLAIEVVSPSDRRAIVEAKVQQYVTAGVPMVVIVYPRTRTVHVVRPGQDDEVLTISDVLDLGEVLPGLCLPVASLFE